MRWTLSHRLTIDETSGRRSRVVLAPRRWRQAGGDDPPAMVTRKPDHQREHEGSRNTIAAGSAGLFQTNLW